MFFDEVEGNGISSTEANGRDYLANMMPGMKNGRSLRRASEWECADLIADVWRGGHQVQLCPFHMEGNYMSKDTEPKWGAADTRRASSNIGCVSGLKSV